MIYWTSASSNAGTTWNPAAFYWNEPGNGAAGAAGVREPRRPIFPTNTGGAALDVPRSDVPADAREPMK